jgi:hypothetical protein
MIVLPLRHTATLASAAGGAVVAAAEAAREAVPLGEPGPAAQATEAAQAGEPGRRRAPLGGG